MKIVYALVALLGAVNCAINAVKDLGEGTWWIFKEDWKKYYHLKNGKQLFIEGCKFRIGSLDNGRPNANGEFRWSTPKSGDRELIIKRNNDRASWVTFTLQKDGSYTAGKVGKQWKVWNKSGAKNYAGDIKKCGATKNKFKAAAAKLDIAINKISSSASFEKCGQSVQDDCVGTTVEMTEEGWQTASSQLTDTAAFLIKATAEAMASDMSFTMKRGMNSLKCAVTNAGTDTW